MWFMLDEEYIDKLCCTGDTEEDKPPVDSLPGSSAATEKPGCEPPVDGGDEITATGPANIIRSSFHHQPYHPPHQTPDTTQGPRAGKVEPVFGRRTLSREDLLLGTSGETNHQDGAVHNQEELLVVEPGVTTSTPVDGRDNASGCEESRTSGDTWLHQFSWFSEEGNHWNPKRERVDDNDDADPAGAAPDKLDERNSGWNLVWSGRSEATNLQECMVDPTGTSLSSSLQRGGIDDTRGDPYTYRAFNSDRVQVTWGSTTSSSTINTIINTSTHTTAAATRSLYRAETTPGSLDWRHLARIGSPPTTTTSTNTGRRCTLTQRRSLSLRDFQMGSPVVSLVDILGCLAEFAKDPAGTRVLQQALMKSDAGTSDIAVAELLESVGELTCHPCGSHVVRKILELGVYEYCERIVSALAHDIRRFALNVFGCKVIQYILESRRISLPLKLILAQSIQRITVRCIEDPNGNHVLQKCIEHLPPNSLSLEGFTGQVARISAHCYGCRVIQGIIRLWPHSSIESTLREVCNDVNYLTMNQFGNYVIQNLFCYGGENERRVVIDAVSANIVKFSTHKYASNVVETCLAKGTTEERDRITRALLMLDDDRSSSTSSGSSTSSSVPHIASVNLLKMARDAYGNYVIQKILSLCNPTDKIQIITCLREHAASLELYTYGKHTLAATEKYQM